MKCNDAKKLLLAYPDPEVGQGLRDLTDHLGGCQDCSEAAALSAARRAIVSSYHGDEPVVHPFFAARVMTAIREQREEVDVWRWLWRMTRQMAPAMLALVIMLAVFTVGSSMNWFGGRTAPANAVLDPPAGQLSAQLMDGGYGQGIIYASTDEINPDRVLSAVLQENGNDQ